jgi:hypothetical protein
MRLTALLSAVLALSGCGLGPLWRAKAPPPPPGPVPVRLPDEISTAEAPPPTNLPAPPAVGEPKPDAAPAEVAVKAIPDVPRQAPPRTRRRKTVPKVAAEAPAENRTEEPVLVEPPFRLGGLLSAAEKDELRRQTEQMLGTCAAALAMAEGRALNGMQAELVNRVRSFSQQAREVQEKDPAGARSLAAKGRTFADALLAELR